MKQLQIKVIVCWCNYLISVFNEYFYFFPVLFEAELKRRDKSEDYIGSEIKNCGRYFADKCKPAAAKKPRDANKNDETDTDQATDEVAE
jgi:hypothetical protein